jgi:hypothetical protein
LVAFLLSVLLTLQQMTVVATVDRTRVEVGEDVLLTITVEVASNDPVQVMNPSIVGLELLGTTDQSDVSIREGVATRILTRRIRLRATSAGIARIGATQAHLGNLVAQADPVELVIEANENADGESLAPHIRDLVERHEPPRLSADEVYIEVLTSTDSVVLGEQLDLAVVAWFPEQVRAQLRTPPTLQPPELQGAWTYSQGVPHAVDMRRRLRNTSYHVYVHSVVVFPLTPGTLEIGPATVSYSLPMSYSFLSREVRHEPQSDSVQVFVGEQPVETRPSSFSGAAGSGIQLELHVTPPDLAVGDAAVLTAVLTGEGNVALWPEPAIRWPDAVRVYPEGIDVDLVPDAERITGTKTFRYLLVPDSAGTHLASEVSYAYYDLRARRYVVLRAPEFAVVAEAATAAPTETSSDTRVLLLDSRGWSLDRLFEGMPGWIWLLLLLLPPFGAGLAVMMPRLRGTTERKVREPASELNRLATEFGNVLMGLVGEAVKGGTTEVATALRAAGIDAPIATHAARVRERLWQANYGPESGIDPEELTAEVSEILRALTGDSTRKTNNVAAGAALVILSMAVIPWSVSGQSAERLHEAGAWRAAVDSFAARVFAEPSMMPHWYNLGAALESAGETQRARRAWIRAARLAPRNSRVRAAINQLPSLDATSRRLVWWSPVTPGEAFLAAILLWVLTWTCVGFRLRKRWSISTCILAFVCAGYGAQLRARYASPVALVLASETVLRAAPYGPAQAQRILDEGMALRVKRETGSWILVERGMDAGWLMRDEVVPLR